MGDDTCKDFHAAHCLYIYIYIYVWFVFMVLLPVLFGTSCFSFWQTSIEMSKIRNELNDKMSEINRLQMELNRRADADNAERLKRLIATLEKENTSLKVANFVLICNMSCFVKNFVLLLIGSL